MRSSVVDRVVDGVGLGERRAVLGDDDGRQPLAVALVEVHEHLGQRLRDDRPLRPEAGVRCVRSGHDLERDGAARGSGGDGRRVVEVEPVDIGGRRDDLEVTRLDGIGGSPRPRGRDSPPAARGRRRSGCAGRRTRRRPPDPRRVGRRAHIGVVVHDPDRRRTALTQTRVASPCASSWW